MVDTFLTRFWDRVANTPEQTFCIHVSGPDEIRVSFAQIGARAAKIAARVAPYTAEADAIGLVFLPHSIDLYAAFLGTITAHAAPSLMPPRTAKQDPAIYWPAHQALIDRGGVAFLLTDAASLADMNRADLDIGHVPVLLVDELDDLPEEPFPDLVERQLGHVALVQHSSGTTGIKKGCPLTFQQIEEQISAYVERLSLTPADRIVSWLPLYHDMGLIACFVLPISEGMPFVHMDAMHWLSRPLRIWELVAIYEGTLMWLPNFAFEHMSSVTPDRIKGSFKLSSMRKIVDCSETCRPATLRRFYQCYQGSGLARNAITTCYAMAETVFAVSQSTGSALDSVVEVDPANLDVGDRVVLLEEGSGGRALVSSGTLLRDFECRIVSDGISPLPDGTVGNIIVRGPSVFSGYYRNEALTASRMIDGWYHTQDIGFFLEGELYVLGRVDDVIICNGKNIFAHELELELMKCSAIKPGRLIIVPVDDQRAGSDKIAVLAELAMGFDMGEAKRLVGSLFFSHTGIAPHSVHFVEGGWLVKTTSGKLSRQANKRKFEDGVL